MRLFFLPIISLQRDYGIKASTNSSDDSYYVATTDNKSKEGLYSGLDDSETLVRNLIWITQQAENENDKNFRADFLAHKRRSGNRLSEIVT